jgi:signal transduction histidine kinase
MVNNTPTDNSAVALTGDSWAVASSQRTLSELRLILAMAALLGVALESHLPLLQQGMAYAVATVYALISLVTLWAVIRRPSQVRASVSYWIDTGFLLLLLAVVEPASNLFVLLLVFPIMLASFQSGFVQGMAVTLTCVIAYSALGVWAPDARNIHLHSAGFGPVVALAVLGFMSARWGDNIVRFKQRLTLLREISAADAQMGEAGVLVRLFDSLRRFAGADRILAMLPEEGDGHCTLYEIWRDVSTVDRVPSGIVREFLDLPAAFIAGYNRQSPSRLLKPRFCLYDIELAGMVRRPHLNLGQLADLLATRHYQCFPLRIGQEKETGRVCLCYDRPFRVAVDYAFLHQIAVQIALRLDNLRLVNRLTTTAATGERRRISRDLHDSTVQPYVGLRMGLEALKRKTTADNPLHEDVADLIAMADASIAQLRGYIVALRGQAGQDGGHVLPALRAQVEQFQAHSGIKVNLNTQGDQAMSKSQLDEFRHIVSEGLSNIRRHGQSEFATVILECAPDSLVLEFINPAAVEVGPFHPRSLSERASELGGRVEVIRSVQDTRVRVTLPVWSRQPSGSAA